MAAQLAISLGQCSDRGHKPTNQDFHGAVIPGPPLLDLKGIAIALADGISSSDVSAIASETAVASFLDDYYCTASSWTVQAAATRVIHATNAWLHVQTRQGRRGDPEHDPDRGHVCTFDAIVLLSRTAHIFHVGDARIYRIDGATVEQLTEDHSVQLSSRQSYLGRALGVNHTVEIDYQAQPLRPGDVFVLATDGVHAHIEPAGFVHAILDAPRDLDAAAAAIVARALANGSRDNLTVQIVRIDAVPHTQDAPDALPDLPLPPPLEPGMLFDGYRIVRTLHASSRSHVHLAVDTETEAQVALKTPSVDLRDDPAYLRRLMTEEWVARRLDNPHVLRAPPVLRARRFIYAVAEYVDGQTLTQWMRDHPRPDLESVRAIVEQVARGLRAFHRKGMLHQDLRPENILIDRLGTVRIIDFGSVRIGGVPHNVLLPDPDPILGTVQFTAPEYFIGEPGTPRSDLFSLGVVAYQMLTGNLPYGTAVAMARSRAQQRRLVYRTAYTADRDIPAWIDGALEKAVAVDPLRRYDSLSAFVADLRQPNEEFTGPRPLLRRDPVLFWKLTTIALALLALFLAYRLSEH